MFKHSDKIILGIDIGGSHISSALVKPGADASILEDSFIRKKIHSISGSSETILSEWVDTIHTSLDKLNGYVLQGIGIAMPGPICTPSIKTIDAVLNSPETDYLFFVARSDFSGYSDFASSYEQHQVYAKAYQQALDSVIKLKQESESK